MIRGHQIQRRSAWFVVAAALVAADLPAADPPKGGACAQRFGIEGVLPGMDERAVRKAVGRGEDVIGEDGEPKNRPTVWRYPKRGDFTVRFDGPVDSSSEARVVAIHMLWSGPDGRPTSLVSDAIARFGKPLIGGERVPIDLVEHGPVLWYDRGCGVVAIAFHEPGPWWDPTVPSLFLEVQSLAEAKRSPPARDLLAGAAAGGSQTPDRP